MRTRVISALVVLAALLGCMLQPGGAAAAIASNPEPGLIARWEPCEPDTGVTVIVDDHHLGEGKIYVGCALGAQANGLEALEHAGFDIEGTKQYGLGFICRIGGEPTVAEQGCDETPGAGAYWTYWHGKPGGRWGFSGSGAEGYKPSLGSVEGWGFNADAEGEPQPRIEPMDSRGPNMFGLPPEQESSVSPAMLAREWLTGATLANVSAIEEHAIDIGGDPIDDGRQIIERLLSQAEALTQAGVSPSTLKPLVALLAASCEVHDVVIEGCELRELYDPNEAKAETAATAVLGLQALGQDTKSFAGLDPRGALESMIEPGGEVQQRAGGEPTEDVDVLALTALALARSGTLSANALASVDLLLAQQQANGQFGSEGIQTATSEQVQVIQALSAAAQQGSVVLGKSRLQAIEAALPKAGVDLERTQEHDGSVRQRENTDSEYKPTVASTSQGAVGLALAGRRAAAERAAKWVSSYQVTAEYAGHGDTEAGEHTPAETLVGAFMASEGALKEALIYGEPTTAGGPAAEAQEATWPALLALTQAGPYGPYYATFDQESLFFENRPLGSPTKPLAATLTNHDVRPVTITALELTGGQSKDFQITGGNCAGRTLQPGDVCEVQVAFDPSALGLRETQLQAALAGTSQTIDLPLTGTGTPAPEPQPQPKLEPKTEPGPVPVISPLLALTPGPAHTSGPVADLAVESISPARLLLKLTAPGVATVKIAHLLGKGHHRHFQTVKTIIVKAGKAGVLNVKLPRLVAGSYQVSISFVGAKTVTRTLTVPRTRR
jgi:hypothetical protein